MFINKFIIAAAVAAFTLSPSLVQAEDANPKISYSAKKQGRVAFQKQDDAVAAQAPDAASVHPADIEPAAGDFELENISKDELTKSIKLPRK